MAAPDCVFLTCVHSYPEFLYIQDACFKKFLKQTFTFLVVDDSEDPSIPDGLKRICHELGYKYVRCPPPTGINDSSPSFRHAHALNYGWKVLLQMEAKYVGTFDTDLVPVCFMDLDIEMKSVDILAVCLKNKSFSHFWPGLTIFKVGSQPLEELRWDLCSRDGDSSDTGGATTFYIDSIEGTHTIQPVTLFSGYNETNAFILERAREILPPALYDFCVEDCDAAIMANCKWYVDILGIAPNKMVFFHLKNISNWAKNTLEYHEPRLRKFTVAIEAVLQS